MVNFTYLPHYITTVALEELGDVQCSGTWKVAKFQAHVRNRTRNLRPEDVQSAELERLNRSVTLPKPLSRRYSPGIPSLYT
jgi:hypothetical protein